MHGRKRAKNASQLMESAARFPSGMAVEVQRWRTGSHDAWSEADTVLCFPSPSDGLE